jgi:hypothetical protein
MYKTVAFFVPSSTCKNISEELETLVPIFQEHFSAPTMKATESPFQGIGYW